MEGALPVSPAAFAVPFKMGYGFVGGGSKGCWLGLLETNWFRASFACQAHGNSTASRVLNTWVPRS